MFRWALNVVLLLLSVAFGSMLTLHGETYSLFYLLGVKDHTAQVVCCFLTGWLFFAWLVTLWICRAKIYKDVLTAEKQDKFFPASEKAKKCYRQNKALFWRLRLYLAFAEKEKEFLQRFRENCGKKRMKHSGYILSSAYLYLLEFLSGTKGNDAELDQLIRNVEDMRRCEYMSYLLKMVQCCIRDDIQGLHAYLDKMPQYFCVTFREITCVLRAYDQ